MAGTIKDVLAYAESQIGQTNGAKYFSMFGEPDRGPWCVAFVRACMKQGGVEFPWDKWFAWDPDDRLTTGELVGNREARIGGGVSFDFDGGNADHVGIIEGVHDWGLSTIEGNTDWGRVAHKQREWSVVRCVINPIIDRPKQDPGKPKNDNNLLYRAHVQDLGWLDPVRDGQTAGITGEALRLEAIKLTPPEGVELAAFAHVEDIGTLGYPGIRKGKSSETGSSENDPIIGTVGLGKRLEALRFLVVRNDGKTKGKKLRVQVHVQDYGWRVPVGEDEWAGTIGQSKRIEAVRLWFE